MNLRRALASVVGIILVVIGFVAGATQAVAAPLTAGTTFLSMGDSYAMGAPQDGTATNNSGCKRNNVSYNSIIAGQFGLKPLNVSCSSATTSDMINGSSRQESQLNAITPDVSAITVSAGGNDVQFVPNVIYCVFMSRCTDTNSGVKQTQELIRNTLPANLDTFYGKIRQRTSAPVFAVGYAIYIASSHSKGEPAECGVNVNPTERVLLNKIVDDMNNAVAQAAQRAGFTYVDPFAAGSPFLANDAQGQALDMCSNSTEKSITTRAPIPYHPTLDGVKDYATIIKARIPS